MLRKSTELVHEIANKYNFLFAKNLKKMTDKQLQMLGKKLDDSLFSSYIQWRKWDTADEKRQRARYLESRRF